MTEPADIDDTARGLMLGLLVGDASDQLAEDPNSSGPLQGGALGQIACYTLEGFIRALLHDEHKESILDPLGCVWRAYGRWALGRGLPVEPVEPDFPDWARSGWLRQVQLLSNDRGTAPATAAAVATRRGSIEEPVGSSAGHHALNRSAPLALVASYAGYHEEGARKLAALTHGDPRAWDAAAAGVLLLAAALRSQSVPAATQAARARAVRPSVLMLLDGDDEGAPIGTAPYCFVRAVRTATSGGSLSEVVLRANEYGVGCATYAGALHGAIVGVQGLGTDQVSRVELGWVADQLARDIVRQEVEHPGPGWMGAGTPKDPLWTTKYPPN